MWLQGRERVGKAAAARQPVPATSVLLSAAERSRGRGVTGEQAADRAQGHRGRSVVRAWFLRFLQSGPPRGTCSAAGWPRIDATLCVRLWRMHVRGDGLRWRLPHLVNTPADHGLVARVLGRVMQDELEVVVPNDSGRDVGDDVCLERVLGEAEERRQTC